MSMVAVSRPYATTIRRMFRRIYDGGINDAVCWLRCFRRDFFFHHVHGMAIDKRLRWAYANIVLFFIKNIVLLYEHGKLAHSCVFLFYTTNIEILDSRRYWKKGSVKIHFEGDDIYIDFRGFKFRIFFDAKYEQEEHYGFFYKTLLEEVRRLSMERNI